MTNKEPTEPTSRTRLAAPHHEKQTPSRSENASTTRTPTPKTPSSPVATHSSRETSILLLLILSIILPLTLPSLLRHTSHLPSLPLISTILRHTHTMPYPPTHAASAKLDPNPSHQPATSVEEKEKKYSERELREWDHLREGMEYYHTHFRHEFNTIYELADGGFSKRGMNLPSFLRMAKGLYQHLEMHHTIEERHIFPILAKKMPQFKAGARENGQHIKSHRAIHNGLEAYNSLLTTYTSSPPSYDPHALRANMDSWRKVLFDHLEEETHDLSGGEMRKAGWTLEEIRRVPM